MSEVLEMRNNYRMEQWADIIRQCLESGLSNKEFCRQNGISEKTYYYRLRKMREAAAGLGKTESRDVSGTTICKIDFTDESERGHILIQYHDAEIKFTQDISPDTLKMMLCVLKEI